MAAKVFASDGDIGQFQFIVGENETVPGSNVTMEDILRLEIGQSI